EKLVEEQLGGDFDLDLDGDGGFTIGGEDGNIQLGGDVRVPADFPSGIPLPDGELFVAGSANDGWTLTYQGVDQQGLDRFVSRLKSAGFEEDSIIGGDGASQGGLHNGQWGVVFVWSGNTLILGVSPR